MNSLSTSGGDESAPPEEDNSTPIQVESPPSSVGEEDNSVIIPIQMDILMNSLSTSGGDESAPPEEDNSTPIQVESPPSSVGEEDNSVIIPIQIESAPSPVAEDKKEEVQINVPRRSRPNRFNTTSKSDSRSRSKSQRTRKPNTALPQQEVIDVNSYLLRESAAEKKLQDHLNQLEEKVAEERKMTVINTGKMTEKEIKAYRDAFKSFDADGDNTINISELGNVMRLLGQNPNPQEIINLIKEVDVDNSQTIDFQEFLMMMKKVLL